MSNGSGPNIQFVREAYECLQFMRNPSHLESSRGMKVCMSLILWNIEHGRLSENSDISNTLVRVSKFVHVPSLCQEEKFEFFDSLIQVGEMRSHMVKGEIHQHVQKSDGGKEIEEILKILPTMKMSKRNIEGLKGRAYVQLGKMCFYKHDMNEAMKYFSSSEKCFKIANETNFIHVSRIHRADCHLVICQDAFTTEKYFRRNETIKKHANEALKILHETLEYITLSPNELVANSVADMFSQIGRSYFYLEEYVTAKDWTDRSIRKVYEEFGANHPTVLIDAYYIKYSIHLQLQENDQAMKVKKLIETYRKSGQCFEIPGLLTDPRWGNGEFGKKMNQELRERIRKSGKVVICGNVRCGRREDGGKFKRCGRCKRVYYCSRDCQKKDWKNHKIECRK